VTVDAGSRQGVARDMAVVDADGLVGRVTQVTTDYATVLLITDPSSGIAATLAPVPAPSDPRTPAPSGTRARARGRAPGVIRGSGAQLLSFQPLRAGTPVRRGDPVLTQAYQGGVFPAGLPIGVVERVDPAGAASLVPRVAVRPYAALGTLDVVAIVVDRPSPGRPATRPAVVGSPGGGRYPTGNRGAQVRPQPPGGGGG
jgi:rod shape-determining protein MreC